MRQGSDAPVSNPLNGDFDVSARGAGAGAGAPEGTLIAVVLGAVVVALLVAGAVGIAIHRSDSDTKTTAAVIPAGFQHLFDTNDHISFAVPDAWRIRVLPAGTLSNQVAALKATDPQLAGLASLASTSGQNIQIGVVAIDSATRLTLVTISFDAAGVKKLSQIPVGRVKDPLIQQGAKNIETTPVHLPLGDAEQVSNQLPIGASTVSEVTFYFVRGARIVEVVLVSLQSQPPITLAHQIEGTVAAA